MIFNKEPLLNFGQKFGFITQWHLCGPFEAGLEKNFNPNLFDKKFSAFWLKDHLEVVGGVNSVFDIFKEDYKNLNCEWKWEFAQPLFRPELRLSELREFYPLWEEKLKDINTNQWSKLYYAMAILECVDEKQVRLKFCGWDGCRLWVNGTLVFEEHSYHKSIYEKEEIEITLKKGTNQILFQLDRDGLVARIESIQSEKEITGVSAVCLQEKPIKRKISTFFQLHEYLEKQIVLNRFSIHKHTSVEKWKTEMHTHYLDCLGKPPDVTCSYGEYQQLSQCKKEKYIQEEYLIEVEGGGHMPCVLLKPNSSIANGISLVLLHGHVGNYRTLLGEIPPNVPRLWVGEYRGDYARRMAEKGFTVITYCARGFSVRKDLFSQEDPCNKAQMMSMAMGLQLPRLHISDIHLVYQLLIQQPGVNKDKIGISGLSGGGTLAYLAGAFDDKFKAVAVFCGLCSYKDYAFGEGCGLQVINNWFPKGDTGDLLGLIAPRPLFIGQGKYDSTFNSVRAEEAFKAAQVYYKAWGLSEKVSFEIFPLAHEYEENLAENFFLKSLG